MYSRVQLLLKSDVQYCKLPRWRTLKPPCQPYTACPMIQGETVRLDSCVPPHPPHSPAIKQLTLSSLSVLPCFYALHKKKFLHCTYFVHPKSVGISFKTNFLASNTRWHYSVFLLLVFLSSWQQISQVLDIKHTFHTENGFWRLSWSNWSQSIRGTATLLYIVKEYQLCPSREIVL